MTLSRRRLLSAAGALAVPTTLAACGTTDTGSSSTDSTASDAGGGSYPVQIEHIYGTTTIERRPERIATLSWVNTDTVLSLGVVPVAVPALTFGGNDNQSTDWIDAKLDELGANWGSDSAPTQYSEADGTNIEAIAEATPDLIVAAYSGITEEEYQRLSEIAPVIGPIQPDFTTSWQEALTATATALGAEQQATRLITDLEGQLAAVGDDNNYNGTRFIAGNLDAATNTITLYTGGDTRSRFFTALGLTEAPVVAENAPDDAFFFEWSAERADELDSQLFYTWIPADSSPEDIAAHPLFGQIPAVAADGLIVTATDHETLSISAASVLSLPWAIENIVPRVTEAVQRVGA